MTSSLTVPYASNGACYLPCVPTFSELDAVRQWDLTDSYIYAQIDQVPPVADGSTALIIGAYRGAISQNSIELRVNSGQIAWQQIANGVSSGAVIATAWDPVNQRFLRIRHSSVPSSFAAFAGAGTLSATALVGAPVAPVSAAFAGGGALSATATIASTWTPAQLSTMVAWIDTAQDAGKFTDGQAITSYTEHYQGLVFNNVTTPAPTWVASAVNGNPRIKFNGTSGGLMWSGWNPGTAGVSLIIVMQTATPTSNQYMITFGTSGGECAIFNNGTSTTLEYTASGSYGVAPYTWTANTDFWAAISANQSTQTFAAIFNGSVTSNNTMSANFNIADAMRVGWALGPQNWLNGLVAEAMFLNGPISAADLTNLTTYLHNKYGM